MSVSFPDLRQLPPGVEFTVSVQDALTFLGMIRSTMDILQLYQECFPEEFARDDEADLSIFPIAEGHYSPREVRFFRLVDTYYFPVPLDFMPYDIMGERQYMHYIPIVSMGFDLEDEDEYEQLSLGWKLLLYLLGGVNEQWFRDICDGDELAFLDEDLFRIPLIRGDVDASLLYVRSEAQGGECSRLMLAIEMLQNRTSNVWLDETMENPCMDFTWTRADIEELRDQHLQALDIREKAIAFSEWLEDDPVAHFALLARLWNSCARDTPKRSRVMTITPEQFVNGFHVDQLMGRTIALPAARTTDFLREEEGE